ncbi:MAG: HD domain-containing protein [Muribaculaceae bacterium]|nr:HD domain-containing protein [Muribaculaceae bacterium]
MVDYLSIINKYYIADTPLYKLLICHSAQVAEYAMGIIKAKGLANIDKDFVYEAAMLHDIGIYQTNAPSIYCFGSEPYLCHGIIGAKLLRAEGLNRHALVCERHIGAGLTAAEIKEQSLPLPMVDYLPQTIEEKLVCYADNFFSKSKIAPAKTIADVKSQMSRYGEGTMQRLGELITLFG